MRRIGLLILLATVLHGCNGRSAQKPPNILLILIDDMGWKDVGYAGSTYYDTPHIDRLASEGVYFVNAYSAAPVCTPSRGALFSGKCPGRTQLTTVFDGPAGPDDRLHDRSKYRGEKDQYFEARHRHALPAAETIIPKALGEGGYATAFFGKWHIGECPGYYPDDRGFDVAKGYRRVHGLRYGHFGDRWPAGNFANLPDPDSLEFIPDILTDECVQFIKEHKDGPFFAVLSHYIVHTPITPRPEKVPKYRQRTTTDQNNPEYAALVESVDESVGQVLEALRDLGLEENTMVVFTSDNGGLTPDKTSNYPLMGGKSFPFEAGMKVPLIVKWPERITPGVSDLRVVGTDLYPTMLDAAGMALRPAQHTDGVSLLPALTQEMALPERPIVFHFPHYTHATGPFSALIENDWKLIRFYNDEAGRYLLYNLDDDPEEQTELGASHTDKKNSMAARLDALLQDMGAEMPIENPEYEHTRSADRLMNLKFTKTLAEKERKIFETRLSGKQ
jgi:arylsulfatase A-like enzyme